MCQTASVANKEINFSLTRTWESSGVDVMKITVQKSV